MEPVGPAKLCLALEPAITYRICLENCFQCNISTDIQCIQYTQHTVHTYRTEHLHYTPHQPIVIQNGLPLQDGTAGSLGVLASEYSRFYGTSLSDVCERMEELRKRKLVQEADKVGPLHPIYTVPDTQHPVSVHTVPVQVSTPHSTPVMCLLHPSCLPCGYCLLFFAMNVCVKNF